MELTKADKRQLHDLIKRGVSRRLCVAKNITAIRCYLWVWMSC